MDDLLDAELKTAEAAVEAARSVRTYHRKRTQRDSAQRKTDIEVALKRLRDAMKPLRSRIGAFPYRSKAIWPDADREKVYAASKAIQAERRKLHEMTDR